MTMTVRPIRVHGTLQEDEAGSLQGAWEAKEVHHSTSHIAVSLTW